MANTFSLDVKTPRRIVDYVVEFGTHRCQFSGERSSNFTLASGRSGCTIWVRLADSVKSVRFVVYDDKGNAFDCGTVSAFEIKDISIR